MLRDIFFLVVAIFAAIGLVHSYCGMMMWWKKQERLTGCTLVVNITPEDMGCEEKLDVLYTTLMLCEAFRGVVMEIHCYCEPHSENHQICRLFARDKELTLVEHTPSAL